MANRSSLPLLPLALGLGAVLVTRALVRKNRAFDLRGKVVIVTGGSRGLGLVLARQLAREGAKLAICARTEDQLRRAEDELRAAGAEVFAQACDVSSPADVKAFVEEVLDHFGRIDVLINNAAIIQVGPFGNMELSDYHQAMNTNFFGALHAVLAVVPVMQAQGGGRIVNISSVGGKIASPHLLPYCASKYALGGFSKGLRAEVARDNIVVTTVFPGLIRTGSSRNAVIKGQYSREYLLFKTADSTPLVTASAEDAAAQTLDALKAGRAELVITFSAKMLALINELFPELTTDTLSLINRLLPKPVEGPNPHRKGYQSETAASHRGIPARSDEAALRNNEF